MSSKATSDAESQLYALAMAANQHALEKHRQTISPGSEIDLDRVDPILDRHRPLHDADLIEPLTLCYGAWFGEWLRLHFKAQWTGLDEPTPPRVRINGASYGPLDAVRRRLIDPSAPSLRRLLDELKAMERTSQDTEQQDSVLELNRTAWDAKSEHPRFTFSGRLPESAQEALAAIDPWLRAEGILDGRRVLCLAAGGGTHGPLHALAGARVTVVDFSPKQLERDRRIADELGLSIETIEAPMDNLSSLADQSFDVLIHPVSLCYVKEVSPVYQEIARVLRSGGLYISQQKQPASMQASVSLGKSGYTIEHPGTAGYPLPISKEETNWHESGTQEFVHPIDSLLGKLCLSGFTIEAISEPPRADGWATQNSPEHRACYLPPYLKIKARRR